MQSNNINSKIIINTQKESNDLIFFEDEFNNEINNKLQGDNKLLIIGAVGKMRTGKSSAENNFYNILTNKSGRPFSEISCCITNTRGIHIIAIPWEDINNEYKQKLINIYNEKIDIILLDCEGTESSNNVSTSRLYLANMLINSVIHIHVSKAIDQNFATKLSQSLISSQEILNKLEGASLQEILPCLYILIKDTNLKAFENAQLADPTITCYQDLLKKYDDLLSYYNQFPKKDIKIIPSPKTDDDGNYIVEDKNSNYFKELHKCLDLSLECRNLKTKRLFVDFLKKLVNIINTGDMLNVKTELEFFYKKMFLREKSELLKMIISNMLLQLENFLNFSLEELEIHLSAVKNGAMDHFNQKMTNISCKWIFKDLEKEISEEIIKILNILKDKYLSKKTEYELEIQRTKKIESKTEDVEEERETYKIDKKHGRFINMWKCCAVENRNNQGCCKSVSYVTSPKTFLFITYGSSTKENVSWFHPKTYGKYCEICLREENSMECSQDVSTEMKKFTRKAITGFNLVNTMDDWEDKQFQSDAFEYLENLLNQIDN